MNHDAAEDVRVALNVVKDNLLELLAGFEALPSSLRIEAGGVTLDAQWPQPVAAPVPALVPSPVPVAAAPPTVVQTTAQDTTAQDDAAHELRAPSVGTFYRASEPGAAPFVEVGDVISKGTQVAIIEVMKLMIPVEADVAGTVVEVLVCDGEPVEHDTPLFRVESTRP